MTGPGGFRAEPDRLTAHADELAGIAEAVRRSRPTAAALSPGAYGLVGGLFAASATGAMGRGALAVTDLAAALQGAADRVQACAEEYRRAESAAAERFAGIEVPAAGPDR
ncbi:type VII secretion target [Pseudonocardia nantongensis]|uniref:type VII secretion target n=1 Tax=Pseudonocardia nantongensis TaxID=1181885 RepID=UPI00397A44A4